MQIITLQQGSQEWHAHRATALNASDAPAMLGTSPYKTRAALVQERATGITPEVTPEQQRIFDRGHAIEALARPLAEAIIGEDLSPCVGTDGKYSASFDGITFGDDVAWECKSLNAALREALPYSGEIHDISHGARLPEHYRAQLEQQAMVSGCQRILFTAASLGDDGQLADVRHCWYTPDPAMRQRLVAGWAQFEQDVAAYDPAAERPAQAVAAPVESLPAVVVQVSGALTVGGNLPAFGAALRAFIERIPAKPSTDQEFVDAEAACKALKKAEDALAQAEESALAQVGDVEAMRRTVADLKALARATRLATEKLVKAEKEARRIEIVTTAKMAFNTHVQRLEVELKGIRLQIAPPDFAGAIKGLSSVSSMEEKLTAALLEGKAQANTLASRVADNLRMLDSVSEYASSLFPDRQDLANKDSEVLELLIHKRVADHQAAETARLEAERERIRAEEAAKLQAQAAIEAAAKTEAPRASPETVAEAKAPETVIQQAQAAHVNEPAHDGDTLTLGQINSLIAPLKVDAAGLEQLGFMPSKTVKAAKHYQASSIPAMVQAMVTHLQGVLATA